MYNNIQVVVVVVYLCMLTVDCHLLIFCVHVVPHIVYHVIFSGPVLSDCTGCMYSLCSVWHCIYMAIFILLMLIIRYLIRSNRQAGQDTSSNLWG